MNTIYHLALASALATIPMACSSNSSGNPDMMPNPNGSDMTTPVATADMNPPPPPGPPGSVLFTASGEALALTGYDFPPATPDDNAFVDGWEIRIEELLVTFANFTLSENPDKSPSDQSMVDARVAAVSGPWAVDLQKGGSLIAKGSIDEQAVAIATVTSQNLNGNLPFDPAKRYAFSFDVVPAAVASQQINLDAQGQSDYQLMIQNGYTVLYVGTATFKGTGCTSTNPAYDFTKLPTVVKFKLGFATPTSYLNCQNPDNDPATPLANETHQRGIQIQSSTATVAQATIHAEHPFGESVIEDAPLHFDPLAALAKKDTNNNFVVTQQELKAVNFTAFKDTSAAALPWRSCVATYIPPNTSTSMGFDSDGIPYDPAGNPALALRDYLDYAAYSQSTQGHLNADGLCFVKRSYLSPQ